MQRGITTISENKKKAYNFQYCDSAEFNPRSKPKLSLINGVTFRGAGVKSGKMKNEMRIKMGI